MSVTGKAILRGVKGGSGSGNFGHSGRPGKLGGSVPKGGAGAGTTAAEFNAVMKSPGIDATSKLTQVTGFDETEIAGMVDEILAEANPGDNLKDAKTFREIYDASIADRMIFKSPADATDVRRQFQKAAIAKQAQNLSIPLGGSPTLPAKGYSIKFEDIPGYHKISGMNDKAIEKKLSELEKATGKKTPRDSRTDFPSFTVYRNGEEQGGG